MTPCLPPHVRSHNGFTLIEIIVTLLLVGVTAAIMFPVLGTNLIKSPEPITRIDNQYRLVEEMDTLTAIYRDELEKNGSEFSIAFFKTNFVDPILNNIETNPNLDSAVAQFIEDNDKNWTYETSGIETSILMVALTKGNQTLYSIFSE